MSKSIDFYLTKAQKKDITRDFEKANISCALTFAEKQIIIKKELLGELFLRGYYAFLVGKNPGFFIKRGAKKPVPFVCYACEVYVPVTTRSTSEGHVQIEEIKKLGKKETETIRKINEHDVLEGNPNFCWGTWNSHLHRTLLRLVFPTQTRLLP